MYLHQSGEAPPGGFHNSANDDNQLQANWNNLNRREMRRSGSHNNQTSNGIDEPSYLSSNIFHSGEVPAVGSLNNSQLAEQGLSMGLSTEVLRLSNNTFFSEPQAATGIGLGGSWDAPIPPLTVTGRVGPYLEASRHSINVEEITNDIPTDPEMVVRDLLMQHGGFSSPGGPISPSYSDDAPIMPGNYRQTIRSPSISDMHGVSENDDGSADGLQSPVTPTSGGPQRASSPFSTSSNDDYESQDQDQNYAAKAVFGALRVVGQTLAIAYEQIKLDNQIQAVKNMASYAGAMFGVGGQQGAQQPFPTPQPVPANYVEDTETLPGMPSGKRIKVAETELEAEVVPDQGTDVKDALRAFEAIESAKKGELSAVQSKIRALKDKLQQQESFLTEQHFANKKTKKLHPETYEQLFFSVVEDVGATRQDYLLPQHPRVEGLLDLAGTIYFLSVAKNAKKPPQVGFPFRSYSDSHYTSVDRSTPVICKVKEWPHGDDPQKIWRLYHYYLGSKKKKRKNQADDE